MLKQIRNYFITGLVVLLPLLATIYILSAVISMVEQGFGPLIEFIIGKRIYGLSIIISVGVILGVGVIATNVLGKKLIEFGERILTKIPIVRNIYLTVQQIIEALFRKNKTAFRKVVVVEYPRQGIYQIGFLTKEGIARIERNLDLEVVSIFIPTTPNPTSGMLVLIPKEEVTYLDMTVEEGLKLIVSGGTIVPEEGYRGS
ncbi:hypothetical protein Halha_1883 [Halobacteroides halobius DSM 5150]|uniref:DUF502 domain-containing protein n=1 Tax=Halobacteroides halobius (strain ATCC 35273 / DSM 5150 / MD-1) TaxID=748449 RepID=L0KBR4_HALHC|nr:DUF502 domain-containing protein [Halobacteroides halobius]AGB41794.1 hypothetical protein Halha_1883 [Halobacteroides halobius DSM 5150]